MRMDLRDEAMVHESELTAAGYRTARNILIWYGAIWAFEFVTRCIDSL